MERDNKFLNDCIEQFDIAGQVFCVDAHGNGHINDTFRVVTKDDRGEHKYILQKVNGNVFKKPEQVLSNIEKVTAFLKVML